jgi:hypothetical protein
LFFCLPWLDCITEISTTFSDADVQAWGSDYSDSDGSDYDYDNVNNGDVDCDNDSDADESTCDGLAQKGKILLLEV